MSAPAGEPEAVLAIVGAGPRATGLLERLAANAPDLWPADRPLRIHLVDPHPPGPGRIWRDEQSPLLRMNSMAEDVTMFTDSSSVLDGPVRPGLSLAEWAARIAGGAAAADGVPLLVSDDPAIAAETRALAGTDFATRRVQGAYLDWVFRRAVAALPPSAAVVHHRAEATAVTGPPDGPQRVHLAGRPEPLRADFVVLAQGHLASAPRAADRGLAGFARRHGLFHLPPDFSSDADLSGLRPGEPVILRGFGLAFVDLMVLLTEGRGGRYRAAPGGELEYLPSGREPVLHVGSRRGVPYHAKTGYRLRGPRPPLPRYFGPAAVDRLLAAGRPPDFRRDVWPLLAKEIGFGHYHELFHAHPERTALPRDVFLDAYDRLDWYSPAMAALTAAAVPDPADRLDLEALDRPLAGRVFASPEAFQEHLRGYLAADAARREDPGFSADLGAFLALLSVYGQLPRLAAGSVAEHLDGWWHGFFSLLASGPPGFRLRRLEALSRAGVVRFLGAGLRVEADEAAGLFAASSPTVPGHTVRAAALVEAYLPGPTVARTADPLLRNLRRAGAVAEEGGGSGRIAVDPDGGRLVDPRLGGPHPRRFALGAPTSVRGAAAFARPGTNAPAFRSNDATARELLRGLAGQAAPPAARRARRSAARAT